MAQQNSRENPTDSRTGGRVFLFQQIKTTGRASRKRMNQRCWGQNSGESRFHSLAVPAADDEVDPGQSWTAPQQFLDEDPAEESGGPSHQGGAIIEKLGYPDVISGSRCLRGGAHHPQV
ncbi:unnamed protein product [Nesidiocoris tenuis]|uniref:Uncharacterized protein n=1 Tax=Nesidiocoris tenuis TaxID=355587 RepID=A0A6H5HT37_9HEMI|nr:unnamed protein product [Nesidiocoris tenuis]